MRKLAFVAACMAGMAMASVAPAATLNIAGATGVRNSSNSACSDPNIPTGEMFVTFGAQCVLSYPLSLPVGATIDSIQVAYNVDSLAFGTPSIVAYLGQNRINPKLGAIAIAGASANPNAVGQGFLNLPNLGIAIAAGSIYWLQISDTAVSEVSSVTVAYH
jgi:hypothetical protein